MTEDTLLTGPQVQERLHISRSTLHRYIRRGRLKASRLAGGERGPLLIKSSEVERLLKESELA